MQGEESRTMAYVGCAGCLTGSVGVLGGGAVAAYGALTGVVAYLGVGVGIAVVFALIGVVGAVVNNIGFGRYFADRFKKPPYNP